MDRHGLGPRSLTALRPLLSGTRQRGHAEESGEVTPGFASVAAAVLDHNAHPVAAIAVTYPEADPPEVSAAVTEVRRTAAALSTRLGGSR